MKRMMLVGETGAGKTTLLQYLKEEELRYHKTQQVYFDKAAIDTPGEFAENRFYHNALVSASVEADVIALVQSVTRKNNYFPPLFSSRFTKTVIGIVAKSDLAESQEQIEKVTKQLKLAGAKQIFIISTLENQGLVELKDFLS